ncbi:hypothetical protein EA187_14360 [Lujinxingia sediminis]|uniref:PA domain-containing protein n=1 Tax=Lujinxingia sediminis TaxID=2480984 RepID=A0ABY0CQD0_9DELT|nr:hypothetical protein [Lujinxingia sediminis]RVU42696.1 hypothetical protein EA187_14360 [Lujinxingia sediminis]
MTNKRQFRLQSTEGRQPGRPYGQYSLQTMFDNAEQLHMYGGTSHTHSFFSGSGVDDNAYGNHRAFASVASWATVMVIPYYVNPGLHELLISLNIRVGHGPYDKIGIPSPVSLRYCFASNPTQGGVFDVYPKRGEGAKPGKFDHVWQRVNHTWDCRESVGTAGRWDYLVVAMRSYVSPEVLNTNRWNWNKQLGEDLPSIDDKVYGIQQTRRPDQVVVQETDPIYGESGGPEFDPDANHTTCAALITTNEIPRWYAQGVQVVDHVGAFLPRVMRIYPHVPELTGQDGNSYIRYVAKVWCSYAQFRSIGVREKYGRLESVRREALQARKSPDARALQSIRQSMESTARRPRLLWAGTPGVQAPTYSNWYSDRNYRQHHPHIEVLADDPVTLELPAPSIAPAVPQRRIARIMIAGLYRNTATTYADYEEARQAGARGTILVNGEEHEIVFVPYCVGGSHMLEMKHRQYHNFPGDIDPTGPNGTEQCFREGMLDFGSHARDGKCWDLVEIELPWDMRRIEITIPAEAELEWLDGSGSDRPGEQNGSNRIPKREHCSLHVLGYSIWNDSQGVAA